MSTPFGAGLGRSGELCGAVAGALMALGLARGATEPGGGQTKESAYAAARELVRRFRGRNGAIVCRDLLGFDIGTPQGSRLAKERNIHAEVCPRFVGAAAAILEDLLAE